MGFVQVPLKSLDLNINSENLTMIVPSELGSLQFSLAKNDQDTGTKHKSQGRTAETHKKSSEVHEANHGLRGEFEWHPKETLLVKH